MSSLKPLSAEIAQLDPERDHLRIAYLLTAYVFPWDIERALEFALFRTYCAPSISKILAQTGELLRRTRKRYDDTELIMYELVEHGYDSERGRRALRRMNQMHGRFPIANEDLLYVLSTFTFEPIRWMERYGWRPYTANEKHAWWRYYREIGTRMNIKDLPDSYAAFEQFNVDYERKHFRFASENQQIALKTNDLFLGFYLPRLFWPLARPFLYALMDEPLLRASGFPDPPPGLRAIATAVLRLRAKVVSRLPERRAPVLGTQFNRPTYPEGYEIEELGTFVK